MFRNETVPVWALFILSFCMAVAFIAIGLAALEGILWLIRHMLYIFGVLLG